jgi:hypothetical protein
MMRKNRRMGRMMYAWVSRSMDELQQIYKVKTFLPVGIEAYHRTRTKHSLVTTVAALVTAKNK